MLQIGETAHKVMAVTFYTDPDLTGTPAETVTTGTDGKAYIYGLAYSRTEGETAGVDCGDPTMVYYLVETEAPDGYNLLAQPVRMTVNGTTHVEANALRVENTTGFELPTTGGMGTERFTTVGLLLMCGTGLLLLLRRRKAAV